LALVEQIVQVDETDLIYGAYWVRNDQQKLFNIALEFIHDIIGLWVLKQGIGAKNKRGKI
jgi:hypothetical protein